MGAPFGGAPLPLLGHRAAEAGREAGIEMPGDQGFTPHITLAYVEPGSDMPPYEKMPKPLDLPFDTLTLVVGPQEVQFPLGGKDDTDKEPHDVLPNSAFSHLMAPNPDFMNLHSLTS